MDGNGAGSQSALTIDGSRITGADVRQQNVTACIAIANVVKTSLGPIGLDKMMVDDIGDVTITNDGATILRLLEVQHPAAKVLCDLANLQDQEVGDGTTSVVILAAELLKRANDLIKQQIHPTNVIAGYRSAAREACKFINSELATKADALTREQLIACAKTCLSSKIIGAEGDFFAGLCVDAMLRVKVVSPVSGKNKYPLNAVNVLKQHGASAKESTLIEGFALNCTVASQAMPKTITKAKIACLDMNLNKQRMRQGVSISITDPAELEKIRMREGDIAKEHIQMILATGANVVLTTKGIDDMALKYFVEAGAMAVRRVKKTDLKRIAKAIGAEIVLDLASVDGGEKFDASVLGECDLVQQTRIADDELILLTGCKNMCSSSLVLRGANGVMLEEMDRSVHDCLCIVKRALESNALVAGGGAVETALNVHLEQFANNSSGRDQLAITAFAEAMLVIPKQLSVNAAQDAVELVAQLRAAHYQARDDPTKRASLQHTGLDLSKGCVRDNLAAGVLEPAMSKVQQLKSATEAAITILRISDLITLNPRQREQEEDDCN